MKGRWLREAGSCLIQSNHIGKSIRHEKIRLHKTGSRLTRPDNSHSPHSGCSEDIDVQVFRVWELKENSNVVNGRLLRLSFVFRITRPFS